MTTLTLRLGLALAMIGVASWAISGFGSPTALIPTGLGLPIAACAFLTQKRPHRAIIYMHIAVVFAVILFAGSASRIASMSSYGSIKSLSVLATTALSFVLIAAFVKSFVDARKAKAKA